MSTSPVPSQLNVVLWVLQAKIEVDWARYVCVVNAETRRLDLFAGPKDEEATFSVPLRGRSCTLCQSGAVSADESGGESACTEVCNLEFHLSAPSADGAEARSAWSLLNRLPLLSSMGSTVGSSLAVERLGLRVDAAQGIDEYWFRAGTAGEANSWVAELCALCSDGAAEVTATQRDQESSLDGEEPACRAQCPEHREVVQQGRELRLGQALLIGSGWGVGAVQTLAAQSLALSWPIAGSRVPAIGTRPGDKTKGSDVPPALPPPPPPPPDVDVQGLDEFGLLEYLIEWAGRPGEFCDALCARLAALHATLHAKSVEQLLPALVNIAISSPAGESGRLESTLADIMAQDIHFAFTAVSAIEAAGVAQQPNELFSALSIGMGGEGAPGRDRIQGALDRLRLLAETAAVSGKRMGQAESAEELLQRASRLQLEQETRLRASYPTAAAWRDEAAGVQSDPEGGASGAFERWRLQVARRKAFFFEEHDLVDRLCSIANSLGTIPKGLPREQQLVAWLRDVNQALPNGCYIPLCSCATRHRVLCALVPEEAVVLSSFNHTPYLVLAEVIELDHAVSETLSVLCASDILRESLKEAGCTLDMLTTCIPTTDRDDAPVAKGLLQENSSHASNGEATNASDWCEAGGIKAIVGPGVCDAEEHNVQVPEMHSGLEEASHPSALVDGDLKVERGGDDAASLTGKALLARVFGEPWSVKTQRLRERSVFGNHPGWRLMSIIAKADHDLRQEQFAMLLLGRIKQLWAEQGLGLRLTTYGILATAPGAGLIEFVPDSVSLASLRKRHPGFTNLADFYRDAFGGPGSAAYMTAQDNFMRSTAAYSVCCYVLQLKDRHDGNILIQRDGGVVHVDFGFMMGRYMNEVVNVERAPFKLTQEYVDAMGGEHSACFLQYIALCIQGLKVLRTHSQDLLAMCRAMAVGSPLCCVAAARELQDLESRLCLDKSDKEMVDTFVALQSQALRSWSTTAYDRLQKILGVH